MRKALVLFACATFASAQEKASLSPDADGYAKAVEPFFAMYCAKCHTGAKPKGNLPTDAKGLPNDFTDVVARGKWKEVANVLNSHEMPPKGEKQPAAKEVAAVTDWISAQAVRAELDRRESNVVLRRLNRAEYKNTVRDLLGIDFDVSGFPQDPPAGGFDNNGGALTVSPLHVETYLNAAKQVLDRALVEVERPKTIKWRFTPKAGAMDQTRVKLDDQNNPIVNGNNNVQDGEWVVVHVGGWDRNVDARDFRVPVAGDYMVRLSTAVRVPDRKEVVKSAEAILAKQRDNQNKANPKSKQYHEEAYTRDLEHFKTGRRYDYGSPRVRFSQQLGPQPKVIAEFDAGGTKDKPKVHETLTRFTTESAGVTFENAYAIPSALENWWFQEKAEFARPELLINWFELEGPLYDAWPPKSHTGILFESALRKTDERKYAAEVLAKFMRKAYRRPVSDDEHLETSFVRESEAFFQEVLNKDNPATTLVKSDFVTINERLARFYGIDGVKGDEMRAVKVPDGVHRGGIPTQGSILTTTSNGTRTSPVKRGTRVLKTLLGIDPGLPVANAGEIAPKVPGIDKATVRKRLEIHRKLDQCARCHNKIDPLGFALENFNAAGEWREQEGFGYKGRIEKNDPKIDAGSEMPDGTKIVGVEGLQAAILKDEDKFLACLANKVLTYSLGRETGLADQPSVKVAVAHMKANGKTVRSLLAFVATCEPFETK